MKRRYRILNILLYLVFAFYLLLLLAILFRTEQPARSINIVPFHSIVGYMFGDDKILKAFALSNVLGNVVIFVPLGVYLTLFNRGTKIMKTILWVFLISFVVEIIQYIFRWGICDIDDIILNVFGGLIGAGLYRALWMIFKDKNKVRNIIAILAPICGILSFVILILYNR